MSDFQSLSPDLSSDFETLSNIMSTDMYGAALLRCQSHSDKHNEGAFKLLHEAENQAFLRDDKAIIIGNLNYKEINWEQLDSCVRRESWRYKIL